MKEIVEKPHNRKVLYGSSLAICVSLLLAGFVWDHSPKLEVSDYEASLALNMGVGLKEESEKDIQEILARDPENIYALLMKAYILYEKWELEEAAAVYEGALAVCMKAGNFKEEQPQILDGILDTLSRLSLRIGRFLDAKKYAEERIRLFGENVPSKLIIALSYFSLKDDKSFEENLDRAVEMGIFDPGFKIKLDSVIDNREMLNDLYLRSLQARAKYEHRFTGKVSM